MNKELIQDIYEATPLQQGIFIHALRNPSASTYHQQLRFRVDGELKSELIDVAIQTVAARHDILRTRFIKKGNNPLLQVVLKTDKIPVVSIDAATGDTPPALLNHYMLQDKENGFDLGKESPLRVALFQVGEKITYVVLSYHHMIMDGWSVNKLFSEFFSVYQSLRDHTKSLLQPPQRFAAFIDWLKKQDHESGKAYWHKYLKGFNTITTLASLANELTHSAYEIEEAAFVVPASVMNPLRTRCDENAVTLNNLVTAVWGTVIGMFTQSNDVVFGSVVSVRPGEPKGMADVIGLCINTVPTRITWQPDQSFWTLVHEVQNNYAESVPHHYLPLTEIVSVSNNNHTLFDHIVSFNNYETIGGLAGLAGWQISEVEFEEETNYSLALILVPGDEELRIRFRYNKLTYTRETIDRIHTCFASIFERLSAGVDYTTSDLLRLPKTEHDFLMRINDTDVDYDHVPLHVLFESNAMLSPHRIAVRMADRSVSYADMNVMANQFGHYLTQQLKIEQGKVVAIYLPTCIEMVAIVLGAMKAGLPVLTLDPTLPAHRATIIIDEASAAIVFTGSENAAMLDTSSSVIHVDAAIQEARFCERTNPELTIDIQEAAYILFTSGSTGKPNGARLTHLNLSNQFQWFRDYFDFGFDNVLPQKTVLGFGDAIVELLMPITVIPGTVFLRPSDSIILEPQKFLKWLTEIRTTHVQFVPSVYDDLIKDIDFSAIESLKAIILSGEKIKSLSGLPVRMFNMYGCSEGCSVSTMYAITNLLDTQVIGKPIANTRIHLLNDRLERVLPGTIGEIYISGKSVCAGYHNKREENWSRFVPDPFEPEFLMYKTGDLGKWRPDGNLQYCGRLDSQVKIRGVRIELGDIDYQLNLHPIVECALVMDDHADDETVLVAFVILKMGYPKNEGERTLRNFLTAQLPSYMCPAYYEFLSEFPQNTNGKIDRSGLIKRRNMDRSAHPGKEVPETYLEMKVQLIWNEILGAKYFGRNDNFFEVGGHSLKAVRLASRIEKELEVNFGVADVFAFPTIAAMSDHINTSLRKPDVSIPLVPRAETYELTPAQGRIWLQSQREDSLAAYNMVSTYLLSGALDPELFDRAFQSVVLRHESLRTNFVTVQGEPRQRINNFVHASVEVIEPSGNWEEFTKAFVARESKRSFDLERDLLIRIYLICIAADKYICATIMHHIISDGWSIRVLNRDFMMIYAALVSNASDTLPELKIQYKDFAQWQRNNVLDEERQIQKEYWINRLSGKVGYIDLPFDLKRPAANTYVTNLHTVTLDADCLLALRKLNAETRVSLFSVLVSAVSVLMHYKSEQRFITLGTAVSGRSHIALEDQVGCYINMVVLNNEIVASQSANEMFQRIHNNNLEAFYHQDYPFDLLTLAFPEVTQGGWAPLFNVYIDYHKFDFAHSHAVQNSHGIAVSQIKFPSLHGGKFDLDFTFVEEENTARILLYYNTSLFLPASIQQMADAFIDILLTFTAEGGKEKTVGELLAVLKDKDQQRKEALIGSRKKNSIERLMKGGAKNVEHLRSRN